MAAVSSRTDQFGYLTENDSYQLGCAVAQDGNGGYVVTIPWYKNSSPLAVASTALTPEVQRYVDRLSRAECVTTNYVNLCLELGVNP